MQVVSLHPGFVDTEIFRSREDQSFATSFLFSVMPLARLFAKSRESGAETSIYCAVSADVESGSFYEYVACILNFLYEARA